MNKKYFIFGGVILAILVLAFGLSGKVGSLLQINSLPGAELEPVVVELTEAGFSPNELTILKGQKVIFKTSRGKQFWPASNPHPTHIIYDTFDPQEPVPPEETWAFQFKETGTWKYHDHLFPYYTGTINVVLDQEENQTQVNLGDCESIKNNETKQVQCWDDLVRSATAAQGPAYALRLMAALYDNPVFAGSCHSFTHTIGASAYYEFKKTNKIDVSKEMNFCGFGFFHGLMETLIADGGTVQTARDLCASMDKASGSPWKSTGGACFHGIGHGLVDGSDKKVWGNPQALVAPGLELCDEIAVTFEEHYRCYSGAFNSMSIAYSSKLWGLETDPIDPLKFCREQKEQYKTACYSDMTVAVMRVVNDDVAKAAKYAEAVKEDEYAAEVMKNSTELKVRTYVEKGDYNFKEIINVCHTVQDRLRLPCIIGFAIGLVEFGPPENEHITSLSFCNEPGLVDDERRTCFKYVVDSLRVTVSPDELKSICQKIDEKYLEVCGS